MERCGRLRGRRGNPHTQARSRACQPTLALPGVRAVCGLRAWPCSAWVARRAESCVNGYGTCRDYHRCRSAARRMVNGKVRNHAGPTGSFAPPIGRTFRCNTWRPDDVPDLLSRSYRTAARPCPLVENPFVGLACRFDCRVIFGGLRIQRWNRSELNRRGKSAARDSPGAWPSCSKRDTYLSKTNEPRLSGIANIYQSP